MSLGSLQKTVADQLVKFNDKRYLVKIGTEGLQTVTSQVTFKNKFYLSGIPSGDTVEEATNPTPQPCPPI